MLRRKVEIGKGSYPDGVPALVYRISPQILTFSNSVKASVIIFDFKIDARENSY